MKKKLLLFAILLIVFASAAFTQNNWVSIEQKGPGFGLRYERVIIPHFTVGAYFSYGKHIMFSDGDHENFYSISTPQTSSWVTSVDLFNNSSLELGLNARWYPFGRRFFIDLSAGLNFYKLEFDVYRTTMTHQPEIWNGWSWQWQPPRYTNSVSVEEKSGTGLSLAPGFGWTIDIGRAGGLFLSPGVKVPFTFAGEDGILISISPYIGIGFAF